MARIGASVYTSHVPAIGAALDLGKIRGTLLEAKVFSTGTHEIEAMDQVGQPTGRGLFSSINDHANAFSLDTHPDLRASVARRPGYDIGRRGLGPSTGAGS